jgi:DNA-binding response OmpR family regulator
MNKILIVDDEPALLNALVDKFTRSGFEVLIAKNGKEGLKSACKNHPDLILLDVVMPVMDGFTMLYKLRSCKWGKNIKVILLTNLSDPIKITPSIFDRVDDCLVKSNSKIVDVVKKVDKHLGGKNVKNTGC